jgi:hypothetical protein
MSAKIKPVSDYMQNIDNKTMRDVMGYLKLEDYDVFVRYIKALGISPKE